MPFVISYHSRTVQPVASVESLAEILSRTDFHGFHWKAGDKLLFEDGTESRILTVPGGSFHVWRTPHPADLETVHAEVTQILRNEKLATGPIGSWQELFAAIRESCSPTTIPSNEYSIAIAIRTHFLEAGWWVASLGGFIGAQLLIRLAPWFSYWEGIWLAAGTGLLVSIAVVMILVRIWPNSRYRTKENQPGLGSEWNWWDYIIPYLQITLLIIVGLAIARWWRG